MISRMFLFFGLAVFMNGRAEDYILMDATLVDMPMEASFPPEISQLANLQGYRLLGDTTILCVLGKDAALDTLQPMKLQPPPGAKPLEAKLGYKLSLVPERLGNELTYTGQVFAVRLNRLIQGENPSVMEVEKKEFIFTGKAAKNTPVWLKTPSADSERIIAVRLIFRDPPPGTTPNASQAAPQGTPPASPTPKSGPPPVPSPPPR
jgi:hypothetical protein